MKPFDIQTFDLQPGITLIEASAGTGKTFSITEIVSEIIATGQCRIDEILVLTFTNAATAELKERIRTELQKRYSVAESAGDAIRCSNLAEAVDSFDNAAIHTIHGFCQRTLHEFSLECGLSVEFEVLKESREFDSEVRNAVFRRIQREAKRRPALIPYCSSIGFEKSFLQNILGNRQARVGIAKLRKSNDLTDQDVNQALAELRQSWLEEGEAIQACLLHEKENPLYRRGKYVAVEMEKHFRILNRWTKKEAMDADLFLTFDLYRVSTLQDNLKKKAELPDFRFFTLCESFADSKDALLYDVLEMIESEMSRQLEALNQQQQKLRYDDLLERLLDALKENPLLAARLRERYQFGLIDEFQDTDPVQFEILSRIFTTPIENSGEEIANLTRPLILIGDPKQAIYGFRGGDIFTYLKAKQLSREQYFLTTNWRSAPEINDGMNALLSRENIPPFAFSWLGYEPVRTADNNRNKAIVRLEGNRGEAVNLSGVHFRELPAAEFSNQYQIVRQLIRDVRELLKGDYRIISSNGEKREVRVSDVAILVDTNVVGSKIRRELAKASIQATLSGGSSVMESDEAMAWYQILRAILSPNRPEVLRGALSTAPFAFNSAEIKQLETDFQHWDEILFTFGRAHDHWMHDRFTQAVALLKNEFEWIENLGRNPDPLRALANHHHVLELLLNAQSDRHLQPGELLDWLKRKMQNPDASNETELLRLEREAESVSILTMHKAKGLQFPIVFVPFPPEVGKRRDLEPPFLIHGMEDEARCVYSGNQITAEVQSQREREVLSERLRLSYVAITRAEYQCTIYLKEKGPDIALAQWNLSRDENAFNPLSRRTGTFLWSRTDAGDHDTLLDPDSEVSFPPLREPPNSPENPAGIVQWSFTGMIQERSDFTEPGTDEIALLPRAPEEEVEEMDIKDIHHFPKGAHAGLFFHSLLQEVNFQERGAWPEAVEAALSGYSYETQEWKPVILNMLENLSATPLPHVRGETWLDEVASAQLFRETEFTFPLHFDRSRYESVRKVFEDWQQEMGNPYTLPEVESVGPIIEGYMKGVIDAWFEHEGEIYLVDWKSNWLGKAEESYSPTALVSAMNEHHYHLQYLLYTCALLRYLPLVRPGFDYEHDFAGIYYVFLRGLTPGSEPNGVFYAKAPLTVIDALNRCFLP